MAAPPAPPPPPWHPSIAGISGASSEVSQSLLISTNSCPGLFTQSACLFLRGLGLSFLDRDWGHLFSAPGPEGFTSPPSVGMNVPLLASPQWHRESRIRYGEHWRKRTETYAVECPSDHSCSCVRSWVRPRPGAGPVQTRPSSAPTQQVASQTASLRADVGVSGPSLPPVGKKHRVTTLMREEDRASPGSADGAPPTGSLRWSFAHLGVPANPCPHLRQCLQWASLCPHLRGLPCLPLSGFIRR